MMHKFDSRNYLLPAASSVVSAWRSRAYLNANECKDKTRGGQGGTRGGNAEGEDTKESRFSSSGLVEDEFKDRRCNGHRSVDLLRWIQRNRRDHDTAIGMPLWLSLSTIWRKLYARATA